MNVDLVKVGEIFDILAGFLLFKKVSVQFFITELRKEIVFFWK